MVLLRQPTEAQLEHQPSHETPPTHLQTTTTFNANEPEPLLTLLTSTHPLAAPLINGSLTVYKTAQSYIPLAEWTERNVGLPLAGKIGRVTGVEGGIRWALQRRDGAGSHQGPNASQPELSDVEKGFTDQPKRHHRRSSEVSFETLPAYNAGDRSPPYTEEQQVAALQRRSPPGWRQQLVISTSGLGVAMSDESLRSLRYCLTWLRWANDRLGGAIQNLRELLQRWNESDACQHHPEPMSVAAVIDNTTSSSHDTGSEESQSRQAALAARLAALKADVLQTLKQVVEIVSNYAGGALPENARNLVHRHLTSLPHRFSIANARPATRTGSNQSTETGDRRRSSSDDVAGSAQRVLVLAQEGLDMMSQVSGVVNDTLVSAESWCERLGRKTSRNESEGGGLVRLEGERGQQLPPMTMQMQQRQREEQSQRLLGAMEERRREERSLTVGRERGLKGEEDVDVDVKMEGT